MFQRERHRFPIDIFPKFTYDETGDVGNQEWTNGHTCRNVHTCFAEWHAMFHPHQLFTPTVSNFIGRPLTQHMETHGDQHLLLCFHVRKTTGFERCRFVPPFFPLIARIPGAMLGLSPQDHLIFHGNGFPLPWFPALDQAAMVEKSTRWSFAEHMFP